MAGGGQQVADGRWPVCSAHFIAGSRERTGKSGKKQSMEFRFEKLKIWHLAVEYAGKMNRIAKTFPRDEVYGLAGQLRNASNSIVLNIAEGSGRGSKDDFRRFIDYSIGSLYEAVGCIHLAKNSKYIPESTFRKYRNEAEDLAKRIHAFKRTLRD